MKNNNYFDSAIIMHIPMYSYSSAFNAAFIDDIEPTSIGVQDSYNNMYWSEGYEDSYGVRYEPSCHTPIDDGMLNTITEIGHTKYVLVGHDHINNFVIKHNGVSHIYALKTGIGSYYDPKLNGGTVIEISDDGISCIYHEYVNIDAIIDN